MHNNHALMRPTVIPTPVTWFHHESRTLSYSPTKCNLIYRNLLPQLACYNQLPLRVTHVTFSNYSRDKVNIPLQSWRVIWSQCRKHDTAEQWHSFPTIFTSLSPSYILPSKHKYSDYKHHVSLWPYFKDPSTISTFLSSTARTSLCFMSSESISHSKQPLLEAATEDVPYSGGFSKLQQSAEHVMVVSFFYRNK